MKEWCEHLKWGESLAGVSGWSLNGDMVFPVKCVELRYCPVCGKQRPEEKVNETVITVFEVGEPLEKGDIVIFKNNKVFKAREKVRTLEALLEADGFYPSKAEQIASIAREFFFGEERRSGLMNVLRKDTGMCTADLYEVADNVLDYLKQAKREKSHE